MAVFTLILALSYGQVHELLKNATGFLNTLGHHSILGAVFVFLLLTGNGLILWKVRSGANATPALNLVGITLIVLAVIPVITHNINLDRAKRSAYAVMRQEISFSGPDEQKPDIYFIVMDSYTRADGLEKDFGYDNTAFLDELKSLGFTVSDCSRPNYSFTELAISSTLNLNYLSSLGEQFSPGNTDLTPASALIQNNYARWQLEGLGYKTVQFKTGYEWNDWKDADLFITPNTDISWTAPVRPFENMFLRGTIFRLVADTSKALRTGAIPFFAAERETQVDRVWTMLDWLGNKLPQVEGPKFVYAHINVPHVPFVFMPDGSIVTDVNYYRGEKGYPTREELFITGYVNQVQFLNNRIPGIMRKIIENSNRPVIIILEGDHGFRDDNRMINLSAVYSSDGRLMMDRHETSVNIFRHIFNAYFNGEYPILENRTYISTSEQPYDLTEVPEPFAACR